MPNRRGRPGEARDGVLSYSTACANRLAFTPMELLKEAPPAFEGVGRLFEMARHLPASKNLHLRIGLACDGVLFAHGFLDGFRQVNFLADHLRDSGWREHLLGGDDEMFGCDMLFSWAGPVRKDDDEDPSFIRRPAVQLWDNEDHG